MTLVIAVLGPRYVVLGADSRGTVQDGDDTVQLNIYPKLYPINDRVAALMHGNAPAMRFLLEELGGTAGVSDIGVSDATGRLAKLCRNEMKEMPIVARGQVPGFGFLVGGLDRKERRGWRSRVLGLDSRSGFWIESYSPFGIFGRPLIANYLFGKYFQSDRPEREVAYLTALALTETMSVDGYVGGKIQMAVIRPSGTSTFSDEEAREMLDDTDLAVAVTGTMRRIEG